MNMKIAPNVSPAKRAPDFQDGSSIKIPSLQILNQDGSIVAGATVPDLSRDQAQKIYSDMLYTRMLDERMQGAQRQGRLSFYLKRKPLPAKNSRICGRDFSDKRSATCSDQLIP